MNAIETKWYASLAEEAKEKLFACMRSIDQMTQSSWKQNRDLQPRQGTIGIGGADFDYLLKACTYDAFLRSLRQGNTPQEAYSFACQEARDCVRKWNEKTSKKRATFTGAHELKRWEESGESIALGALHMVLRSIE